MKKKSIYIAIAIVALAVAVVLGIRVGFFRETFIPAETRRQTAISESRAVVDAFFQAVSAGEFGTAEELSENFELSCDLYTGELGALAGSVFSYEILSSETVRDEGVVNTVSVTWLNAAELMDGVAEEAQLILNGELEAAANSSEIYDEDLNFREDVLDSVFYQILAERMENNEAYIHTDTISVKTTDGTFVKVILSEELFNILTNGRAAESK